MGEIIQQTSRVPEELGGRRVDYIAASCFSDYSRSKLQAWIKQGLLQVNHQSCKAKDKLVGGETLTLHIELEPETHQKPENIALNIVYEDDHILVINKSAGLVVHPGAGNYSGTLLNGLLYHCPELAVIPRAGIVHRLDKDTTGLMVVAKTLAAHTHLVTQIQARSVHREYEAIAQGIMTSGGIIDQPIGRHPVNRLKMAVIHKGKPSITHYTVEQRYRAHTHIRLKLETGRTHQIRVHMAYLCYPLVGDTVYAGRPRLPKLCSPVLMSTLQSFNRQALHARRLGFMHPITEESVVWDTPLPADFHCLLESLKQDKEQGYESDKNTF